MEELAEAVPAHARPTFRRVLGERTPTGGGKNRTRPLRLDNAVQSPTQRLVATENRPRRLATETAREDSRGVARPCENSQLV